MRLTPQMIVTSILRVFSLPAVGVQLTVNSYLSSEVKKVYCQGQKASHRSLRDYRTLFPKVDDSLAQFVREDYTISNFCDHSQMRILQETKQITCEMTVVNSNLFQSYQIHNIEFLYSIHNVKKYLVAPFE